MARAAARQSRAPALVAALCGLAYSALAAGSGLDRASLIRPELAPKVPRLFASVALRSEGAQSVTQGEGRRALALGERAVSAAPLDPTSTALLGAARYATGDKAGADRAFRIAAQLGWRIPYTQRYMLGRALEVGDFRVAALRLDALARQDPAALADRRLFDPLERSDGGRSALASRMLAAPPWLRAYATEVHGLDAAQLAQRTAVLGELALQGGQVGCETVGAPVSALIAAGAVTNAARLWRLHCPAARQALLYDGAFANAALDQSESEFAWTFVGNSEVSLALESVAPGRSRALAIDSSAPRPEQVVRQLVLLAPGSYRLSWQDLGGGDAPTAQVLAQFACLQATRDGVEPRFDPASRRWSARFTADRSCAARWIGFAAKPGAAGVRLTDVRLEAAP